MSVGPAVAALADLAALVAVVPAQARPEAVRAVRARPLVPVLLPGPELPALAPVLGLLPVPAELLLAAEASAAVLVEPLLSRQSSSAAMARSTT
jgi:hypothetical protein